VLLGIVPTMAIDVSNVIPAASEVDPVGFARMRLRAAASVAGPIVGTRGR